MKEKDSILNRDANINARIEFLQTGMKNHPPHTRGMVWREMLTVQVLCI